MKNLLHRRSRLVGIAGRHSRSGHVAANLLGQRRSGQRHHLGQGHRLTEDTAHRQAGVELNPLGHAGRHAVKLGQALAHTAKRNRRQRQHNAPRPINCRVQLRLDWDAGRQFNPGQIALVTSGGGQLGQGIGVSPPEANLTICHVNKPRQGRTPCPGTNHCGFQIYVPLS